MTDARDRLTTGLNRQRVKLESRRASRWVMVIAVGGLLAVGAWLTILRNVGEYVYSSTREFGFEVRDASGVVGGGRQEVRINGVPVGVIQSVDQHDGHPILTAKVYEKYGEIYRDARATLRPNSALEDMYLDVVSRGTPRAGTAGLEHPVPASRTEVGVQAEDVLQAVQPNVRAHLASLLDQLGNGLADRGESLRETFQQITPLVELAGRLSAQLTLRDRMTRRLVHDTAALTSELGQRDRAVRDLVRGAGETLQSLQRTAPELDATLARLPGTLQAVDGSFAALRSALPMVDEALVGLRPAADALPGGLAALRALSADLRPALPQLLPAVERLSPLARELRPVAVDLDRSVTLLQPQAGAIDHTTRVVAGCSTALQGFFQWTPSVMKMGDTHGAVVRGQAVVGLASTAALKDPASSHHESCAPGGPIGGTPGPAGKPEQEGTR